VVASLSSSNFTPSKMNPIRMKIQCKAFVKAKITDSIITTTALYGYGKAQQGVHRIIRNSVGNNFKISNSHWPSPISKAAMMIKYRQIMPINPQTKPNQNIVFPFPFKVGGHILHTFEQCKPLRLAEPQSEKVGRC
jgi:hypothetical protein